MAEVVLFHHIQGQTDGFQVFAEELRGAGHKVHTPDLFDGQTFSTIKDGAAWAGEVGFGELVDRGVRAVDTLSSGVVYSGISFGVLPAQRLAQTRPGAKGALLFEACVPASDFGDGWPDGVPVQIHGMDADPFFAGEGDVDAARALVEEAKTTAEASLFLYQGNAHLFADSSLASYDREAATLLMERALTFLSAVN
jgi:dienelactone hydrolase